MTFDELLACLQMSRAELVDGLEKIAAFQEQGSFGDAILLLSPPRTPAVSRAMDVVG
jgi:hypothetical protein